MARLFLIGLSALLLVVCIGYTGWFSGRIEVFAEAKAPFYIQEQSRFKSKQSHSIVFEEKLSISAFALNHFSKTKRDSLFKIKSISRFNTTLLFKNQVVKMKHLV